MIISQGLVGHPACAIGNFDETAVMKIELVVVNTSTNYIQHGVHWSKMCHAIYVTSSLSY